MVFDSVSLLLARSSSSKDKVGDMDSESTLSHVKVLLVGKKFFLKERFLFMILVVIESESVMVAAADLAVSIFAFSSLLMKTYEILSLLRSCVLKIITLKRGSSEE